MIIKLPTLMVNFVTVPSLNVPHAFWIDGEVTNADGTSGKIDNHPADKIRVVPPLSIAAIDPIPDLAESYAIEYNKNNPREYMFTVVAPNGDRRPGPNGNDFPRIKWPIEVERGVGVEKNKTQVYKIPNRPSSFKIKAFSAGTRRITVTMEDNSSHRCGTIADGEPCPHRARTSFLIEAYPEGPSVLPLLSIRNIRTNRLELQEDNRVRVGAGYRLNLKLRNVPGHITRFEITPHILKDGRLVDHAQAITAVNGTDCIGTQRGNMVEGVVVQSQRSEVTTCLKFNTVTTDGLQLLNIAVETDNQHYPELTDTLYYRVLPSLTANVSTPERGAFMITERLGTGIRPTIAPAKWAVKLSPNNALGRVTVVPNSVHSPHANLSIDKSKPLEFHLSYNKPGVYSFEAKIQDDYSQLIKGGPNFKIEVPLVYRFVAKRRGGRNVDAGNQCEVHFSFRKDSLPADHVTITVKVSHFQKDTAQKDRIVHKMLPLRVPANSNTRSFRCDGQSCTVKSEPFPADKANQCNGTLTFNGGLFPTSTKSGIGVSVKAQDMVWPLHSMR
ncbi:MAG: hypothetical protein HY537_04535 [Deltaproteobacteria bacterium]|nr:hypothetical protein [Deltaproteobacteria bacterium]